MSVIDKTLRMNKLTSFKECPIHAIPIVE